MFLIGPTVQMKVKSSFSRIQLGTTVQILGSMPLRNGPNQGRKNDDIASYQPEDLDRVLQLFYVELQKHNAEECMSLNV